MIKIVVDAFYYSNSNHITAIDLFTKILYLYLFIKITGETRQNSRTFTHTSTNSLNI